MPVLSRPVNNFLGQVIGNASEEKYNIVSNSSSGKVTFQKFLNSGITLFSSKNSNKSQTFATGAYQRLHEARPRHVVWLWEPEYAKSIKAHTSYIRQMSCLFRLCRGGWDIILLRDAPFDFWGGGGLDYYFQLCYFFLKN